MPPFAVVNGVPVATPPAFNTSITSPSGSPSLPNRSLVRVAGVNGSLNVSKWSFAATGGVLSGFAVESITSIVSSLSTQAPKLSHTSMVIESSPIKSAGGV